MKDHVARAQIEDVLRLFENWREANIRERSEAIRTIEARLDNMNDLTKLANLNQGSYLPRAEYDARHQQLQNDLDTMETHLTRIDVALSRLEGVDARTAQQRTLAIALITVAVAVFGLGLTLIIHFIG